MLPEKLPDNLYWEHINIDDTENSNESYDAARKLFSQCTIPNRYKWGPFNDVGIKSVVGLSDRQIWSNVDVISADAEWILTLIDHILQPSSETDNNDETNIKIIFDKTEHKIWVETKMDISSNTELKPELEITNTPCLFIKPESSADSSTNEDCENVPSNNTKEMSSGDTTTQSGQTNTNSNVNILSTNSPNLTTPPASTTNTTGGKMCKYCGISFTHQGTVEAHMMYYCARRENANSNENSASCIGAAGMPVNRMQKTWRTRQRNRQNSSTQHHQQQPQPAKLFSTNTPMDNISNPASLLALFNDENIQKLNMIDSVTRGTLNPQIPPKPNPNPAPTNAAITSNVLNALFSTLLSQQTNLTTSNGSNTMNHSSSSPPTNTNPSMPTSATHPECDNPNPVSHSNDTNSHISPSTSARHHNRPKHNSLPFCNSCGIYFSSQELYESHINLEFSAIQANPAKFSKLVLAAPVMGQNGLVHYVPVHNFRNLQHSQNTTSQNANINPILVANNNAANPSIPNSSKPMPVVNSNLEDRPPPSPLDLSVPTTGNPILNSTRSPLSANIINKLLPSNNQSDVPADLNNILSNIMNATNSSNNNANQNQIQNQIANVLLASNMNQHANNTSDNSLETFMSHIATFLANASRINNSSNNSNNHPMGMNPQGQQRTQQPPPQLSNISSHTQQQQQSLISGLSQNPLTVNTTSNSSSCNPAGNNNNNCNSINNNNTNTENITRKYLCQHCQTRFQHSPTFKAHQEFYCQGKRKSTAPLSSIPEKRSRNTINPPQSSTVQSVPVPPSVPSPLSSSTTQPSSTSSSSSAANNIGVPSDNNNNDSSINNSSNGHWIVINNGFKCINCGFIGQTRRGIRIHCKSQCPLRRDSIAKPTETLSLGSANQKSSVPVESSSATSPKMLPITIKSESVDTNTSASADPNQKNYTEVNAPIRHMESPTVQCKN